MILPLKLRISEVWHIFMKIDIFRDKLRTTRRMITFVSSFVRRVTQKDTYDCARIQLTMMLFMNKEGTTKHPRLKLLQVNDDSFFPPHHFVVGVLTHVNSWSIHWWLVKFERLWLDCLAIIRTNPFNEFAKMFMYHVIKINN